MPSKSSNPGKHHSRSYHQGKYNFDELTTAHAKLAPYVHTNKYGTQTIDFHNSDAVLALNTALVKRYYKVAHWPLPAGTLCPAVPGRAEYIHCLSDFVDSARQLVRSGRPSSISVLDVGTGASLIYPIIGRSQYGWSFVGTDINEDSLHHAQSIIDQNKLSNITLRQQTDTKHILSGIIRDSDYFDMLMCNPPFYSSAYEALAANQRKNKNLGYKDSSHRNFKGQDSELWYPGGELAFISKMIQESSLFGTQCYLYSTLVSQKGNVSTLVKQLQKSRCTEHRKVTIHIGNKTTTVLQWTYLNKKQQQAWRQLRF